VVRDGLLVILIFTFFMFLYVKNSYHEGNLYPRPDSLEYTLMADTFIQTNTFKIPVGDFFYPPRYPFGFSLLLAPLFLIPNVMLHYSLYIVLFFSLLTLLTIFYIGKKILDWRVGIIAVFFLGLIPVFFEYSRYIMADIPQIFFTLSGFVLFLKFIEAEDKKRRKVLLFFSGFLIGISWIIKYSTCLIIPSFIIALFWFKRKSLKNFLIKLSFFIGGFLLGSFPQLLYNKNINGGFLKNGYGLWDTRHYDLARVFNVRFFKESDPFFSINGEGNFIAYQKFFLNSEQGPFLGLGLIWLFLGFYSLSKLKNNNSKNNILLFFSISVFLVTFLFYSFFFGQAYRYFLIPLSFFSIIGALGVIKLFERLKGKFFPSFRFVVITILLVLTTLPPGKSIKRSAAADLTVPYEMEAINAIKQFCPENSIVIANITSSLFKFYGLDKKKIILKPIFEDEHEFRIKKFKIPSLNKENWVMPEWQKEALLGFQSGHANKYVKDWNWNFEELKNKNLFLVTTTEEEHRYLYKKLSLLLKLELVGEVGEAKFFKAFFSDSLN